MIISARALAEAEVLYATGMDPAAITKRTGVLRHLFIPDFDARLRALRETDATVDEIAREMGISCTAVSRNIRRLRLPSVRGRNNGAQPVAKELLGSWPDGMHFENAKVPTPIGSVTRPAPDRSLTGCSMATCSL